MNAVLNRAQLCSTFHLVRLLPVGTAYVERDLACTSVLPIENVTNFQTFNSVLVWSACVVGDDQQNYTQLSWLVESYKIASTLMTYVRMQGKFHLYRSLSHDHHECAGISLDRRSASTGCACRLPADGGRAHSHGSAVPLPADCVHSTGPGEAGSKSR